ncbi:hypothetical protein OLMES_5227 [Oleiphilus messinensis]|uniref:Uncharacterized protein n=1 Tax=Oleiphilus messinensis TaxID=141451 RepID=A0A1Y0IFF2_9GAMM|nr:hypothetical protein [Oleiphilus messinensis]ARU59211.1 hypothetical protein OLMES_5227 [Oleiphilus messinensis]
MNTDISKFIKKTPLKSLQKYFEANNTDLVQEVDWDDDESAVRKSLLQIAEAAVGEKLALLKSDSERINALKDELGQSILKHSVGDSELQEYYDLENEHDRVLWLFLKDSSRFRQVEDCWYTDTGRNGRMWDAFIGPKKISVSKSDIDVLAFKNRIMELFRAVGKIHIDIFERTRSEGDDNQIELIQIMVYREDLPSTQLAFEDESLVSKIVRPVKEVALTYEPESGHIEVVVEGKENRKAIPKIFSETLLKSPIDGEKIPLKRYTIQSLLKQRTLSFDPDDGIESVDVTMLKVAQPNSYNTVTLDVATKEERSIYDISKEYFGENDPLKSGFKLKQVRISIRFMPDEESRRGKILHVKIREPNGCDLKSKSQKEKLIGDKYLEKWELVEII